jgi:rubrerythrin
MGTHDMLKRSITYEEGILRNYLQYAVQAEGTDIGELFKQLAVEKKEHLAMLRSMLQRYCKP